MRAARPSCGARGPAPHQPARSCESAYSSRIREYPVGPGVGILLPDLAGAVLIALRDRRRRGDGRAGGVRAGGGISCGESVMRGLSPIAREETAPTRERARVIGEGEFSRAAIGSGVGGRIHEREPRWRCTGRSSRALPRDGRERRPCLARDADPHPLRRRARSGSSALAPLIYGRHGDDYLIVASKGGTTEAPTGTSTSRRIPMSRSRSGATTSPPARARRRRRRRPRCGRS